MPKPRTLFWLSSVVAIAYFVWRWQKQRLTELDRSLLSDTSGNKRLASQRANNASPMTGHSRTTTQSNETGSKQPTRRIVATRVHKGEPPKVQGSAEPHFVHTTEPAVTESTQAVASPAPEPPAEPSVPETPMPPAQNQYNEEQTRAEETFQQKSEDMVQSIADFEETGSQNEPERAQLERAEEVAERTSEALIEDEPTQEAEVEAAHEQSEQIDSVDANIETKSIKESDEGNNDTETPVDDSVGDDTESSLEDSDDETSTTETAERKLASKPTRNSRGRRRSRASSPSSKS